MERKLTVVLQVGADSVVRRSVMTAATIVGIALLLGCQSNRCHRCCSQTTPTCHNRVCQQSPSTQLAAASTEPACHAQPSCQVEPSCEVEPSCQVAGDYSQAPVALDDLNLATKAVGRVGQGEEDFASRKLYGHGENYEWLMGVLHRVHIPRKGWKVRYAPLDQRDRWGGSVVPAPDVRIEEFEDGANVYVEGEVIGDRASLYLTGPRYRITAIRLVNEGDARRVSNPR